MNLAYVLYAYSLAHACLKPRGVLLVKFLLPLFWGCENNGKSMNKMSVDKKGKPTILIIFYIPGLTPTAVANPVGG